MNYFISDLHIGHKNVLSFDGRPFASIEEHDNYIMTEWNKRVKNDDNVYILGDISWKDSIQTYNYFKKLNGKKILIKGNHDYKYLKDPTYRKIFEEISDYMEIPLDDKCGLVLSHYPIPCFKNHYYGWFHFYGHVHNSFEWKLMENIKKQMEDIYSIPCNIYNVGAMMSYINFIPRTFEEIISSNIHFDSKKDLALYKSTQISFKIE